LSGSTSSRSFTPPSSPHRERFIFIRTRVVKSIHYWDSWDWIWFDTIFIACNGNIEINSNYIIIMSLCNSPPMYE
jgi:hypothetical protein